MVNSVQRDGPQIQTSMAQHPVKSSTQSKVFHQPRRSGDQHQESEGFLGSTVKTVFGHCVGIVDVASIVLASCRGESEEGENSDKVSPILELGLSKSSKKSRKRQGDTLEFPTNGGFEDDVSALSARTLEEMERLERPLGKAYSRGRPSYGDIKSPYPGQQLNPDIPMMFPDPQFNKDWSLSVKRTTSCTDRSLGVSTSGSVSSHDDNAPDGLGGNPSILGM